MEAACRQARTRIAAKMELPPKGRQWSDFIGKLNAFRVAGPECEFEWFRRRKRVILFDETAWVARADAELRHD